jgi:hypothetical protein
MVAEYVTMVVARGVDHHDTRGDGVEHDLAIRMVLG